MALLDGKNLAKSIRKEVKEQTAEFIKKWGRSPTLHVVLVGDNPASQIYVQNKGRACKKAGIEFHEHRLEAQTSTEKLLALVKNLSRNNDIDGILVQMPLPDHIPQDAIIAAINPQKDVDGFHPVNLGHLITGNAALVPCTPLGCMRLLEEADVSLKGKNAVVIGRSTIVGKPMALMLLEKHATVTICHSKTEKLAHIVAEADVVVAATGQPELIKGEWIKKGATVLDVGINRMEDGSLLGDVEFHTAAVRAAWISPVPGGVGPMTIACLISNTVKAGNLRLEAANA